MILPTNTTRNCAKNEAENEALLHVHSTLRILQKAILQKKQLLPTVFFLLIQFYIEIRQGFEHFQTF